jgi:hypothetical protein
MKSKIMIVKLIYWRKQSIDLIRHRQIILWEIYAEYMLNRWVHFTTYIVQVLTAVLPFENSCNRIIQVFPVLRTAGVALLHAVSGKTLITVSITSCRGRRHYINGKVWCCFSAGSVQCLCLTGFSTKLRTRRLWKVWRMCIVLGITAVLDTAFQKRSLSVSRWEVDTYSVGSRRKSSPKSIYQWLSLRRWTYFSEYRKTEFKQLRILCTQEQSLKNAVFWDITSCVSC